MNEAATGIAARSPPSPRGSQTGTKCPPPAGGQRGRLFRKYVVLVVAVVVLALLVNGAMEVWAAARDHKAALIRLQSEQAEAAAGKISQFVREIESQLGWTTMLPWSGSGLEQRRFDALRLLRQVPIDNVGERVTLECLGKADRTIWSMADERFGAADPLAGGWVATQAKLTVRFHPRGEARRGRTLPLTITMPHGCNLRDQTGEEQVIGEKYLRRWGILRDV